MDFCTKTNKVKLNPSDTRILTEASHKLLHIGKLDADNSAGVGTDAKKICTDIDALLVKMVLPGVRAAKKDAESAPVSDAKKKA